jgi:hypothetical protein
MKTLFALIIAIPLVLLAGGVGSFIYFGLTGSQGAGTAADFAQTTTARDVEGGRFVVTVRPQRGLEYAISARFESDNLGSDAALVQPTASMTMIDHDMGRTPISMSRRPDGSWNGDGNFPMAGRWRFQISLNGEQLEVDLTAR